MGTSQFILEYAREARTDPDRCGFLEYAAGVEIGGYNWCSLYLESMNRSIVLESEVPAGRCVAVAHGYHLPLAS
jgi:hypothetical protein